MIATNLFSKIIPFALVTSVWRYVLEFLRPVVKWLLRHTTGLCELQRVCYGDPEGAARTIGVETSLTKSRQKDVMKLVDYLNRAASEQRFGKDGSKTIVDNTVHAVYQIKRIRRKAHPDFGPKLAVCVTSIWGYRQLFNEVESLRTCPYDADNQEHEAKVLELWSLLMPNRPLLSRVTRQWQEIGFQGDDPKTDFRGMGLLGLENLLYFARNYQNAAIHVLSHSHHPKHGYSFAIVGINLTSMAYTLWKEGLARCHVYNTCKGIPTLRHFHQFYCYLVYEFDKFWLAEKPADIMEFGRVRDKFHTRLRHKLMLPTASLRMNLTVDIV
nr:EOG090X0AMT [Triops cancriformis]